MGLIVAYGTRLVTLNGPTLRQRQVYVVCKFIPTQFVLPYVYSFSVLLEDEQPFPQTSAQSPSQHWTRRS